MEEQLEQFFFCPYCGSSISVLLDGSIGQEYTEDCEVCCRPIQIQYTLVDGEIADFEARREDD